MCRSYILSFGLVFRVRTGTGRAFEFRLTLPARLEHLRVRHSTPGGRSSRPATFGQDRVVVLRVVSTYSSVSCSPHIIGRTPGCRVDVHAGPCVRVFFLMCLVLCTGRFPSTAPASHTTSTGMCRPHVQPRQRLVGRVCGPHPNHVCVGDVRAGFVSVWSVLRTMRARVRGGSASGQFNFGASPVELHVEGGSLCVALFQRGGCTVSSAPLASTSVHDAFPSLCIPRSIFATAAKGLVPMLCQRRHPRQFSRPENPCKKIVRTNTSEAPFRDRPSGSCLWA